MRPGLRKLTLSVHLTVSVGWIGAVAAYTALDVTAAFGATAETLRAAYLGMGWIAGWVIVPLSVLSLLTGILMSLGTKWGLLRHWWVVISLVLTVFATVILLVETQTIGANALVAGDTAASVEDLRALGSSLVHSVGGMLILIAVVVLNVYKPTGLTPYGWRRQQEDRRAAGARAPRE